MDKKADAISKTIEGAGLATMTGAALGDWVSQNHELIWFAGLVSGFCLTLIGVCVNIYFGYRKNAREESLNRAALRRMAKATPKK
jgi:hypothetical protein